MSTVFISYRREATSGEARALCNDLVTRLSKNSVFMDVDSVALGRDFRNTLHEVLGIIDVMLVIIDKDWTGVKDERGRTRLEDPSDYVRLEVEAALKRDIVVTPVLVKGARMPAPEQLPAEIRDLVYRNGFELSHDRWESDVGELVRRLALTRPEGGGQIETAPQSIVSGGTSRVPSFSMLLEQLFNWAAEQATAFGFVLASPANYYRDTIVHLPDPLSQSIKFLAFVVLVLAVVTTPFNAALWNINIFDLKKLLLLTTVLLVLNILLFLLFCFMTFWAARLLGGTGDLPHTLAAMFYSSALMIGLVLAKYVTGLDPALTGPIGLFGSVLELAAIIWIIVKLVPLIKTVHQLGRLRALLIIALAGVVEKSFEWLVAKPLLVISNPSV
jgi:TIR domain/Yip1 domain